MTVKLHNSDNIEVIEVYLTKEQFPNAYEAKFNELIENGLSKEDAEKFLLETPFQLELYYEKGEGLFGVEADNVESGSICSPYTGEWCDDADVY